jgi:hypothetical protein
MLGRVVFAILGSVVAVALTSCGGPSGAALPHSFGSGSDGIAVRYPAGWALTTANPEHVPDPALCFDVSPAGGGVVLRLVEYLPPYLHAKDLSFYRPRPSHFDLSAFRIGDNDWSPGTDLAFSRARTRLLRRTPPAGRRQHDHAPPGRTNPRLAANLPPRTLPTNLRRRQSRAPING